MGAADLCIITENPQQKESHSTQPDLPGMVNNDDTDRGAAIQKLVPGRFKHVRLLTEPQPDSQRNPVLVAEDTTDGSFVTLQQFDTPSEHARVRECQQRCCLRHNDAPRSPTSGLTSPMSCPKGEPMLCDIYEIHGDGKADGWLAVMEMGTATLADCSTPSTRQQKRTVFLRVARAVQMLHSAGIVHNAIQMQSIIKCSSGYKLGDFSSLQRHGEPANGKGSGYLALSPEHVAAEKSAKVRKCDFATDVWCLGGLLSELLLGEVPVGELSELQTESAGETMAGLITRMLQAEASQRPVIDVVLQEAIQGLYLPDDDKHDPHETLDFDSPVKDHKMIIRGASLKADLSPVHSSKATIDYCLAPPAHSEAGTTEQPGRDVKRESPKHKQQEDKDTEGSSGSNCECRCAIQ